MGLDINKGINLNSLSCLLKCLYCYNIKVPAFVLMIIFDLSLYPVISNIPITLYNTSTNYIVNTYGFFTLNDYITIGIDVSLFMTSMIETYNVTHIMEANYLKIDDCEILLLNYDGSTDDFDLEQLNCIGYIKLIRDSTNYIDIIINDNYYDTYYYYQPYFNQLNNVFNKWKYKHDLHRYHEPISQNNRNDNSGTSLVSPFNPLYPFVSMCISTMPILIVFTIIANILMSIVDP
jgi:hypothetical protein